MAGQNWHSKKRAWAPVVKQETKAKAHKAQSMRNKGVSVVDIAKALKLSKSRIYELLKK